MQYLLSAVFVCAVSGAGIPGESEKDVPLEKLLQWNAPALFGGKLKLEGDDHFEVTFDGPGMMEKGFVAKGAPVVDQDNALKNGVNKKFYTKGDKNRGRGRQQDDKAPPLPGLACVGFAGSRAGMWTSRFPVAGDVRVTFEFRIPNLITRQSLFIARLNVDKSKYLQTTFFNSVSKRVAGRPTAMRKTPHRKYSGPASEWYPRRGESVPMELVVENDKFVVRLQGDEVVSLDDVGPINHGRVAFLFQKFVFTLQNLKISGKLDKKWCLEEIKKLEKKGTLMRQAPEAGSGVKPEAAGNSGASPTRGGLKRKRREDPQPGESNEEL